MILYLPHSWEVAYEEAGNFQLFSSHQYPLSFIFSSERQSVVLVMFRFMSLVFIVTSDPLLLLYIFLLDGVTITIYCAHEHEHILSMNILFEICGTHLLGLPGWNGLTFVSPMNDDLVSSDGDYIGSGANQQIPRNGSAKASPVYVVFRNTSLPSNQLHNPFI
jgi:hypothetical protein